LYGFRSNAINALTRADGFYTYVQTRKVADAAGQVKVAKAKLAEVRNNPKATDSQRLAAEERFAAAGRCLEQANQDATATPDDDAPEDKPVSKQSSAASLIVELALERYHFGVTEEGQPYAVKPGRHVVRMLRGGKNSLRAELSKAFYQTYKKAPPQQALADALLVIEGMAQDEDHTPVHLRVAKAAGAVWLDLGDAAETVVQIHENGWQAVTNDVRGSCGSCGEQIQANSG
jgi:hypothetical protein